MSAPKRGIRAKALAVLAAAVGTAALAAPASPAVAKPLSFRSMTLQVELTGIHVDKWHLESPGFPDPARSWVSGGGRQTLGFSTPRPLRFRALAVSGHIPGGGSPVPLQLMPLAAASPMKGSLRRQGSWHPNDPHVCDREGGCDDDMLVPVPHSPASCPAKQIPVPASIGVDRQQGSGLSVLSVQFETLAIECPWANCPPDMDGDREPLALAQPASLGFGHAVASILRLRRGEEVTLKAHLARGATDGSPESRCPEMNGPGLRECAVTDLTLEVTRLR